MYKKTIILIGFIFLQNLIFSQEIKKDTLKTNTLDEVVITGQYTKQSVKKSVFDVTVINSKTIEQNAANNLADLLNQNLNIHIVANAKEGKSQISLFGLDGQYFKILQDGIPMVSEDGFGNNIDLTQIALDNIKQIEIVEGAMGVTYGENTVSGVINIITKTSSKNKWNISAELQEESVGNEYEWWKKGRHIQKFNLAHNINENFYTSANFSRNHFLGYFGSKKGKNHFLNDGFRGHEWLPKEQMSVKGILRYRKNTFDLLYKVGFFKESLNAYGSKVEDIYNQETQLIDIVSVDDVDYLTNRMTHDFIVNGKIKNKINYNISTAYQEQIKKNRHVVYDHITRDSKRDSYKTYLARKTYFTKAKFNHFVEDKPYDFELGLEYKIEDGFFSAEASSLNAIDADEKLANFDVFISGEYQLNKKIKLRSGFRYSIQSKFDNQYQYSLSSSFLFKNNYELRSVVGSSYRTPNFDELFTYFVDSNHDVQGNENLIPERAFSIFTHFKKTTYFKNGLKLKNKIKVGFLNVNDRIELAVVSTTPRLASKFINIEKFKSVTFSADNNLKYKNLSIQLGGTLVGSSQIYIENNEETDDYIYSFQVNSNIAYKFNKINTSILFNYKFNGKQTVPFKDEAIGGFVKDRLDGFSWSDISIRKTFLNKKLETTIGARNIFNVTTVSSTETNNEGTHTANASSLLGYGTSYFFKLKYNLNIN